MKCFPENPGIRWAFLAALLALVNLVGCAGLFKQEEPQLKEATAEQLTLLLREREEAIQTMKGLFRAQIKGPGIPLAQRVEGAMFYSRTGRLRLQGFNQVGGQLFDLILADDLYKLRVPGQPAFTGRVVDLQRMEKLGRSLQLSLLAMNGAVGIASVARGETVLLVEEGDRYRLDILSAVATGSSGVGRPVRRLWFERRSLEVVQEDRLTEAGTVETTMKFEDFRPVDVSVKALPASDAADIQAGAILKPFRIITQDGQGQGTLQLMFHEIIPNPDLKPDELGVVRREDGGRMKRLMASGRALRNDEFHKGRHGEAPRG